MANKEKMDYLLLDIRELEKLIATMRDAEIYPVSFFSQSFDLTRKILHDLHALEAAQIDLLRKQMEEHLAVLNELPLKEVAKPIVEKKEPVVVEESVVTEKTAIAEELVVTEKPLLLEAPVVAAIEVEVANEKPVADLIVANSVPAEPEVAVHVEKSASFATESVLPEPVVSVHNSVSLSNTIVTSNISLNEILEKKILSDFKKAFSLNDRFYFRRELFAGDEVRMNRVISALNDIHSYEDSVAYLDRELKWNIEDSAVSAFIKLLEKRFS